ncbi:pilus assembly protein TadG-related protein [Aliiroseovarius subalbicans]|uniref:pilus assembly protein TadG-related protein n=1 Tax=Aliiroseovarius subalbicans TaxID=2925840 RepID=UPI001F5938F4|nr:pilus assembly protein TadG-related protein [Aliiroseovarius subalbicans]MCI2400415.1 pilus assembly protein TadG-related protein [Aliiroseovarius subalbicans]
MNFRLLRDNRGYVFFLTLLFLPVFLGVALLVIDLGRGNNSHSDLQSAADALALAAARELDGGTNAIVRARTAMEAVDNTVSFLGTTATTSNIILEYEDVSGNEFTVIFLDDIPANDHDPINQAWVDAHKTNLGTEAEFVYVRASSLDFQSIFSSAIDSLVGTVPISAAAVATSRSAACNVPPVFICNPFEGTGITDLQTAFASGFFHGRIVKLHPKQNQTDPAAPGNFGYLQTNGSSSASAIRGYFAGDSNPTCYDSSTVETKPGYATSIATGYNIRFDIYDAPFKNDQDVYAPAYNVRKGYEPGNGNVCNKQELVAPFDSDFMGFPDNDDGNPATIDMTTPVNGAGGALIGTTNNWDLPLYWSVNHPSQTALDVNTDYPDISSFGHLGLIPSRYDIYRHEIEMQVDPSEDNLVAEGSPGGESGLPICSLSKNGSLPASDPLLDPNARDRRIIFAAVIDCLANPFNGQATIPVNSFVSAFMVRPMEKASNNGKGNNNSEDSTLLEGGTIDIEIVDITGSGGNGSLDAFVRDEAILVR